MESKAKRKKEVKRPNGIALTPTLWDKIDQLAERSGRSRNNYIEQVMLKHVAQTET